MSVAAVLYAAGLVLGLVLVCVVGVVATRNRETPGATPLAVMAGGVALWTLAVLVMVLSQSIEVTRLADKVMYVGIVTVVAAYAAFALDYTGRGDLLTRRTVALLAVVPLLTLVAIATNHVHHLFWRAMPPGDTMSGLDTEHGPLFWMHVAYSYLLLVGGTGLLVRLLVGERTVYRQQAAALTVAITVPWAANALYIFEIVRIDVTPLGFAVSGAALAWAILRADFVRLAPVAREAVVEEMGSAVFVVDRSGRLADVNPAGRRLLGGADEAVVGRDLEALLQERSDLPDTFAAMEGEPREITVEDDAGRRHFEIEVSRVQDAHDRLLGRLVVATEVTRRREREDELRRKNERLDQFAAVVSHDLRNPLSVNTSYLQLAIEDAGDGADEHLEKALRAAERMESIIDDVLALARDGSDVTMEGYVDVGPIARRAWETVDTDGAALVVEDPPTVRADRNRLRRAFENLFRNAVVHGSTSPRSQAREDAAEHAATTAHSRSSGGLDGGEVAGDGGEDDEDHLAEVTDDLTVTVGALPDGDGFYVADDGPGIPADDREAVLEPGESRTGGTGLGLAIVDAIVEGHGWSLDVTESAADGAQFEVRGTRE